MLHMLSLASALLLSPMPLLRNPAILDGSGDRARHIFMPRMAAPELGEEAPDLNPDLEFVDSVGDLMRFCLTRSTSKTGQKVATLRVFAEDELFL